MASPRVTPSASRSPRAVAGSIAPVSSRLPRQATPNRPPSSSANAATAIGRAGSKPSARNWSMAAKADTTPSGPSNAPPSGTESRWLPTSIARAGDPPEPPAIRRLGGDTPSACPASPARLAPGTFHQAYRLPLPSEWVRRPRSAAARSNQARHSSSAGDQQNRR